MSDIHIPYCCRYGYRGHDCRANLHILGSGEIVYFIGQVAVLCNREKHLQRHYREHTAEIKRSVSRDNICCYTASLVELIKWALLRLTRDTCFINMLFVILNNLFILLTASPYTQTKSQSQQVSAALRSQPKPKTRYL